MKLTTLHRFPPAVRFVASVFAVLGLWLLAAASIAPTSAALLPVGPTKSAAPAALRDAAVPPSAVTASPGALDDWDDEDKSAPPKCEPLQARPWAPNPAGAALFSPRRLSRFPDRRATTLVGTVVLMI